MFVGRQGTSTVTFNKIKYQDMKHILDFIYFGEVDVQVIDVVSFLKTAEALQITSLKRFASQSFSGKCSFDNACERSGSESVDFVDSNEGIDLPLERVLGTSESTPSHSCPTSGTESVDVPRRVVESDDCNTNTGNTVEDVRVEEIQVNVEDQMNSFTFVSIPPVLEKTGDDVHCVDVKNPLEVCPHDRYQGIKTEMGIKVEIKTEVVDITSEMTDDTLASKTLQNNSSNESKHSYSSLASATHGNSLISTEQTSRVQTNQNLTLNRIGSTSENNAAQRTEIFDNANLSECEVKKQEPCFVDKGTQCSEEHNPSGGELSSIGYNQSRKDALSDARRSRMKLKEARIIVNRISVRTVTPPTLVDIDSKSADVKETSDGAPSKRSDSAEREKRGRNVEAVVSACASRCSSSRRQRGRPPTASTEDKPFLCNICGNSFLRKGHLSSHLRMHSAEKPFQCTLCGAAFKFNYNLTRHALTHDAGKSHACAQCGKRFKHESYLKQHLQLHSSARPFACPACPQTFKLRSCLSTHLKIHTGERRFECAACGKAFAMKESLAVHMRTHTGEKPYACGVCGAAFAIRGNLRQHERTHTGDKPFACGTCGKAFAHSSHRKRHLRTHAAHKPFACAVCRRAFGERRALQDHALLHSGRRPFRCAACGAAFTLERYLLRHARTHARTERHVCGVCHKPLSSKGALKQHVGTHSAERPFVCGTCGAAFRSKCVLKIHTRVHTGVRPYKCDVCGAAYAYKNALTVHTRGHTGERPYACATCGRAFAERMTLTLHLRTHTGEKPYSCGVCGKAFSVVSSQKRHMKVHAKGHAKAHQKRTKRAPPRKRRASAAAH